MNNVCKRGYCDFFNAMLALGASIHVCDKLGRTPLHYVCFAASCHFSMVERILSMDMNMIQATDSLGKTPLDYITADKWDEWNDFLEKQDVSFWKSGFVQLSLEEEEVKTNSKLVENEDAVLASSLPDPVNALSIDEAKNVSLGC